MICNSCKLEDVNAAHGMLPLTTCLLASFIACFLMPLSMFDSNPSEFPMTAFSELLIYSAVLTVVASALLVSFLIIVRRCMPRLLLPVVGFLIGTSFALYAQGNLIGADYGILDGHQIQWDAMHTVAVVNTVFWLICVVVPILIAIFFQCLAQKLFPWLVPIFLAYVALLSVMLVIANESALGRKKVVHFTFDNFMELSSERNLVLIILDSFDRAVFDRLLADDPALCRHFKGVAYYHNTVGAYFCTAFALPQIVTGYSPTAGNLRPWEYQRVAYREAPFLKAARGLGFAIDAYYDESVCPMPDELDGFGSFGNVHESETRMLSLDNMGYYASLYTYSAFRYLPHLMKRWLFERLWNVKRTLGTAMSIEDVELKLQNCLACDSFSLVPEKKVKIYHCSSIHVPRFSLEKARMDLAMVCRFFDKVRESGIYEKTDFFIMADHGCINRCRPLFMCSNGTDEFKVSEMPFSYRHLCEAFLDSLNGRLIQPKEATSSEMFPIMDSPNRRKMLQRDDKIFDGIGTDFSGNGLELLATTSELDVVVTNGISKMVWNGKEAIIGVPVEKWLGDGALSLTLTFDRPFEEQLPFAIQYMGNQPELVDSNMVSSSDTMVVTLKLPDRSKVCDKRFFKLFVPDWSGGDTPSITKVKIGCSDGL